MGFGSFTLQRAIANIPQVTRSKNCWAVSQQTQIMLKSHISGAFFIVIACPF